MRTLEEVPWLSLLPPEERVALERAEADPEAEEWDALVAGDRALEDEPSRPSRSPRVLVPLAAGGLLAAVLLAINAPGVAERGRVTGGSNATASGEVAAAASEVRERNRVTLASGTSRTAADAGSPAGAGKPGAAGGNPSKPKKPRAGGGGGGGGGGGSQTPPPGSTPPPGQISVPAIQLPPVQVPPIQVPPIIPGVQLPPVQLPPVSLPPIQVPPVQIPQLPQLPPLLPPRQQ
jgi:hypothetical protein